MMQRVLTPHFKRSKPFHILWLLLWGWWIRLNYFHLCSLKCRSFRYLYLWFATDMLDQKLANNIVDAARKWQNPIVSSKRVTTGEEMVLPIKSCCRQRNREEWICCLNRGHFCPVKSIFQVIISSFYFTFNLLHLMSLTWSDLFIFMYVYT